MQNLFDEVGSLDRRCYEEFGLSEDLLMEHAALAMAEFIRENFEKNSKILIVTGSGNNGADGITLLRLLYGDYEVMLYLAKEPKSKMAKLQFQRIKKLGINPIDFLPTDCDIVVDAVLGTGFSGEFGDNLSKIFKKLNSLKAYKISCDVPSGLSKTGICEKDTFIADTTITMGALKKGMFLDEAKDFVGNIKVADLGINRKIYETKSNWKLLDFKDLALPLRERKNTHKGTFGHSVIVSGEKSGASILASLSALRVGSGLVSIYTCRSKSVNIPYEIMKTTQLPLNATALAIGMGLGNIYGDEELQNILENDIPKVIDADMFYNPKIKQFLHQKNLILTPHPKEFTALLKLLNIANINIDELQRKRFDYVEMFCKRYPNIVLVLKGANVIIAKDDNYYINDKGNSILAKGGSGDVLAGIITGLLAQGYSPLQASISGSLLHVKSALDFNGVNFSLSPMDLIENIKNGTVFAV